MAVLYNDDSTVHACFNQFYHKVCNHGNAIYNPFASYAHPTIVRDHANVHKIWSHIPMVADRYPWISPSCGFDIAATALVGKKLLYLKTPVQSIIVIVYFCCY